MNVLSKLLLAFWGLVFMALVAMGLLIYVAFATLRWLLTGEKPQVVLVWQQMRDLRARGFQAQTTSYSSADVVDVESVVVREVVDAPTQLPSSDLKR